MPPRVAYALFMLLAFAVFLAARRAIPRPQGLAVLPRWKRAMLGVAAFIGGALGAKVPFLFGSSVLDWRTWMQPPDGKTITTGLIGAYLAVEFAKAVLGVQVKTGDTFALPLALALAVGRWGCLAFGCCYGVPTNLPWGVDFGDGIRRHPTQIYESLFHLTMAGVLWLLLWSSVLRCQHLKLYLIAYGAYRFATEYIRPEPAGWLGLTFYQGASVVLVVGLSIQWVIDARRRPEVVSVASGMA
jgi:prolipoprotein diacylglyceryltransferase